MEFLLDTDTCIYAIKKHPDVLGTMRSSMRAFVRSSNEPVRLSALTTP